MVIFFLISPLLSILISRYVLLLLVELKQVPIVRRVFIVLLVKLWWASYHPLIDISKIKVFLICIGLTFLFPMYSRYTTFRKPYLTSLMSLPAKKLDQIVVYYCRVNNYPVWLYFRKFHQISRIRLHQSSIESVSSKWLHKASVKLTDWFNRVSSILHFMSLLIDFNVYYWNQWNVQR